MDKRAIGVFDSGLGGLTAVKQLIKVLPNENIVYFGDTGRVPYGSRSNDTIKKYALQDANFLLQHNVKMVIAACGTVSSVAGDLLRAQGYPYTGVVNPTVYTAVRTTKNKRVGVIGTSATIGSHSYKKRLTKTLKLRSLNRTVLYLFHLLKMVSLIKMTLLYTLQ